MSVRGLIGIGAIMNMAEDAVEECLDEIAEDFISESQAVTPVDTGTLQGGHHVAVRSKGVRQVATGAESSAYAAYVHENHRTLSKFFEKTAVANREMYEQALREAAARKF